MRNTDWKPGIMPVGYFHKRGGTLIAAEDTRNSIKLLNYFEIKTPMTSYHEFNKIDKAYQLVDKFIEEKILHLSRTPEHRVF